jgi:uncharacterized protein (DUF1501 family)
MQNFSRRDVIRLGAIGAGTLLLPRAGLAASPAAAADPDQDPHFFLLVVLDGGADPSYMFDARPLSMTRAGKIQNYLGEEPGVWSGSNGVSTLATRLVAPLRPFGDRFSVLNGVYMTPSFDGHLQNMNFLFSGSPFGGDSFIPHLNSADTGRAPGSLDAVLPTAPVFINVNNHSSVVPLEPNALEQLAERLREAEPPRADDMLGRFVRSRLTAGASGDGRMSAGARLMLSSLDQAPDVHHKLASLRVPREDLGPEAQAVALIGECFRLALSRSAIYVLREQFDVHDADQAKLQPKLFADAVLKIAGLFRALVDTPFDAKRSMLDVTTVMVASEFGRTMRAPDMPITGTGTNHNQFANSILLGGKGIRSGLVVGASDLADEKAAPSKAHLAMDPVLEKVMGRPIDLNSLRVRPDQPDTFDIENYLTIGSVVNTVYALFSVPKSRYRSTGRNLPPAPVLNGLLA